MSTKPRNITEFLAKSVLVRNHDRDEKLQRLQALVLETNCSNCMGVLPPITAPCKFCGKKYCDALTDGSQFGEDDDGGFIITCYMKHMMAFREDSVVCRDCAKKYCYDCDANVPNRIECGVCCHALCNNCSYLTPTLCICGEKLYLCGECSEQGSDLFIDASSHSCDYCDKELCMHGLNKEWVNYGPFDNAICNKCISDENAGLINIKEKLSLPYPRSPARSPNRSKKPSDDGTF